MKWIFAVPLDTQNHVLYSLSWCIICRFWFSILECFSLMCLFRFPLSLHAKLQSSHWKGLAPVCVIMWAWHLCNVLETFAHSGHIRIVEDQLWKEPKSATNQNNDISKSEKEIQHQINKQLVYLQIKRLSKYLIFFITKFQFAALNQPITTTYFHQF